MRLISEILIILCIVFGLIAQFMNVLNSEIAFYSIAILLKLDLINDKK